VGVPPRTVQDIEAGRRDPRITTLVKLARALGCEVAELLPPAGKGR
jgi:transcriptional regulator with XRE-family HTH domain